jgi:hypothetical protein
MLRSILRAFGKTFFLTILVVGGAVSLYVYHDHLSSDYKIEQLEAQKRELDDIIQRLQTDRRVAKIIVSDQNASSGKLKTTLLFVEYRRDGSALPPRQFIIDGTEAHIDAEVVKFKDEYVKSNDPLRGQAIMLFTRIYGADQAPQDGMPIDTPGEIPEIYRGIDPKISDFEQDLWNRFWTLYTDKDARDAIGIRAMQGEGLFGPFDKDHVYTITVRPDGATMNVDPIDPIYRAAMQPH